MNVNTVMELTGFSFRTFASLVLRRPGLNEVVDQQLQQSAQTPEPHGRVEQLLHDLGVLGLAMELQFECGQDGSWRSDDVCTRIAPPKYGAQFHPQQGGELGLRQPHQFAHVVGPLARHPHGRKFQSVHFPLSRQMSSEASGLVHGWDLGFTIKQWGRCASIGVVMRRALGTWSRVFDEVKPKDGTEGQAACWEHDSETSDTATTRLDHGLYAYLDGHPKGEGNQQLTLEWLGIQGKHEGWRATSVDPSSHEASEASIWVTFYGVPARTKKNLPPTGKPQVTAQLRVRKLLGIEM